MSLLLNIRILSYWHAGTGVGQSGGMDALCLRDDDGLPMLPGKHLRGLLRQALSHYTMCRPSQISADQLFGTRREGIDTPRFEGNPTFPDPEMEETEGGVLRVDTARLRAADRLAVLGQENDLAPLLFDVRRATAIGRDGVAKPHSLRAKEIALPVTLEALVTAIGPAPNGWENALKNALPLVRAVGGGRTRGLGRCIVTAQIDCDAVVADA